MIDVILCLYSRLFVKEKKTICNLIIFDNTLKDVSIHQLISNTSTKHLTKQTESGLYRASITP